MSLYPLLPRFLHHWFVSSKVSAERTVKCKVAFEVQISFDKFILQVVLLKLVFESFIIIWLHNASMAARDEAEHTYYTEIDSIVLKIKTVVNITMSAIGHVHVGDSNEFWFWKNECVGEPVLTGDPLEVASDRVHL